MGERDVTRLSMQKTSMKTTNGLIQYCSPLKPVSRLLGHLTSEDQSYSWPAPHEQFSPQMIWS